MKLPYIFLVMIFFCISSALASELYEVIDEAHIRVDSTILSDSLDLLNQGDRLKVVGEKFEWYRVILPKDTPCYVSSKLTQLLDGGKVRIKATNVNLRYKPSLEAPIIGTASKNKIFLLIENSGEWLKIRNNSQAKGWVHKKFLKKQSPANNLVLLEKKLLASNTAIVYGTIKALTQMGKDNPELSAGFLNQASRSSLKLSSAYLDILQNILQPDGPKKAYFYQAQNNLLTDQDIEAGLTLFRTMIETKNTSQ